MSVAPGTPFQFAVGTEILLEPSTGIGFGVGLVRWRLQIHAMRKTSNTIALSSPIPKHLKAFQDKNARLMRQAGLH